MQTAISNVTIFVCVEENLRLLTLGDERHQVKRQRDVLNSLINSLTVCTGA